MMEEIILKVNAEKFNKIICALALIASEEIKSLQTGNSIKTALLMDELSKQQKEQEK